MYRVVTQQFIEKKQGQIKTSEEAKKHKLAPVICDILICHN